MNMPVGAYASPVQIGPGWLEVGAGSAFANQQAFAFTETSKDVLNVRQVAERFGVHENTVRNWEKSGLLRAIRLPGSGFRRFRADDVARLTSGVRPGDYPDEPYRTTGHDDGEGVQGLPNDGW
jgi:excisionase family DNA binding protein